MSYLTSSIGRKQLMALTGLGLSGFVLTHMIGNLLIFAGPEKYNTYSHLLISNPLIYVAEVGLVALFLVHVATAIALTIENKRSHGKRSYMTTSGAKGVSFASKYMVHQGLILLIFTILHLISFKYGPDYRVTYEGIEMRDLHALVLEVFHKPTYVAWYVICLILLGLHLSHGFASAFQSIGVYHPRYTVLLKRFSLFYAVVVAAGFIAPPVYIFFVR